MKALILGVVVLAAVLFFLFRVSRYSSWRPGRDKVSDDGFGNFSEQRFLEEDHPVTMSGPYSEAQVMAGREAREKNLGLYP